MSACDHGRDSGFGPPSRLALRWTTFAKKSARQPKLALDPGERRLGFGIRGRLSASGAKRWFRAMSSLIKTRGRLKIRFSIAGALLLLAAGEVFAAATAKSMYGAALDRERV